MTYLIREKYLSMIRPFYHEAGLIKVLTGVRRCGKSTLMQQISDELSKSGVCSGNMVFIDLDSKKYHNVRSVKELESIIDSLFKESEEQKYLFIDEIQNVKGFERLINAYRNDGISVFITGSNSYLLSGELITKLTGRYLEFRICPFSFSEVRDYMILNGSDFSPQDSFRDYIINGGYPMRFQFKGEEEQNAYVKGAVGETITKDILLSRKVRNRALLSKIMDFIAMNPSSTISSTSLTKYLRSEGINTKASTINNYLDLIFSSNVSSKCNRFDIIGKRALKTLYKSYLCDTSIHFHYPVLRQSFEMGHILENIVYNELISRGYDVFIGKMRDREVDFIVTRNHSLAYIQVAYLIPDEKTMERETAPLIDIKDNYPKYLISMDPIDIDILGIKKLNLVDDFLLGEKFQL